MLSHGLIEPIDTSYDDPARSAYEVTDKGEGQLGVLGIDVGALRATRRRFAGHCLDWTERRPHLNGGR